MSEPLLVRTSRLLKEYRSEAGELLVLRGIDLEIRRGEVLAIMGKSGVGKSTLLNILGLLDRPSAGLVELHLNGTSVNAAELSRQERADVRNRHFGFVFQFYHLLPDLDVLENVLLPAMITRRTIDFRREEATLVARARELLARVEVDREKHTPGMLSGGERQRVAIARALMNEPELLFCDEPTGNLDTSTAERIHELLLDLNRRLGTAILLVTHDMELADRAHRRLHMVDGRFEG